MEIRITTAQILKVFEVLSWIIFIGLCIEAGGIIFNTFYTFFINPVNTHRFWKGIDLSGLYNYDHGHFLVITFLMAIVSVLKSIMFYRIVKLFSMKGLNMDKPFSEVLRKFMLLSSCLALGIAFFANYGSKYAVWLSQKGIKMPDAQSMSFAGADVWLFMAVVLFILVQIVKRGIEIQTENDLTI